MFLYSIILFSIELYFHHQAYPSSLLPPFLLQDRGSTQCIHGEEPEALPSLIKALRDDRVKDRQEVNLLERIVLIQSVFGQLLVHPFFLFPPRIHYKHLPINLGSTHHRR